MTTLSNARRQLPISGEDHYTLKRYEVFRAAADYVASAFAEHPAVKRIALIGSVASAPTIEPGRRRSGQIHEPKDVDLAVWLNPISDLDRLRKRAAQALRRLWQESELGVAHHQVDIFVFDAASKYVGRLCRFNQCPKHKPECRVHGCGEVPFLQQHDGFRFDTGESLRPDRIVVLFERH